MQSSFAVNILSLCLKIILPLAFLAACPISSLAQQTNQAPVSVTNVPDEALDGSKKKSQAAPVVAPPVDEKLAEIQKKRDHDAAQEALTGWWTESQKNLDERMAWWREARFGTFIHWGVYSTIAGEWDGKQGGNYSEHIMRQLRIPLTVYRDKVASGFDPEKFNADDWAEKFQKAGMSFVVITAKHHDGFAMWPTKIGHYNIRDCTPFKRDLMKELADACRKRGMKFGFYYSHAFDWEDPNAPGNDWDYHNPGGDLQIGGGPLWFYNHPDWVDRAAKYVDQKAIPQIQELVKMYQPDIFWFDTSGKLPFSEQLRIVQALRKASPNVVINGRAARGEGKNWGDYLDTADNPAEVRETSGDWEGIPTVNNSYGYNKFDKNFKTPEFFIQLVAKITAKGGNTLLNFGPMGDGLFDTDSKAILAGLAKWSSVNAESIHGAGRTPLDRQAWGDSTLKGKTLYLHVFQWPSDGQLMVGGLTSEIASAYLLSDPKKTPLKIERLNPRDLLVHVPSVAPDTADSVVVLDGKTDIKAEKGRLLASNILLNQLLAFDGEATSDLTFGDGKASKYWVTGFKPNDSVTWQVRCDSPTTFDVSIKTSAATAKQAGSYQLTCGDQTLKGSVAPSSQINAFQVVELGQIKISSHQQDFKFQVLTAEDGLMNLFEVDLTPAKDKK